MSRPAPPVGGVVSIATVYHIAKEKTVCNMNSRERTASTVTTTAVTPAPVERPAFNKFWWHVNKTGFPILKDTWEKMWTYAVDTHPEGESVADAIRGKFLKKPAIPPVPSIIEAHPMQGNLWKIQQYMNSLQYNHTGTQFFDINKNKPLSRLMDNAKEIITESLPIKCLEAVILALYLASPLINTQRFCISFKTSFKGHIYRHVVLGVHHKSTYGALGMSRRTDLMYKSMEYKTMSDLIMDFVFSYKNYEHRVDKVRLSPYISHDCSSGDIIRWKHISFNLKEVEDKDLRKSIDHASRALRSFI